MDNTERFLFIAVLLLVPLTWGWYGLCVFLPMLIGVCMAFDFHRWYFRPTEQPPTLIYE